jgi:uncharacterized SAM-binding protein YcdF (DUF218 family)
MQRSSLKKLLLCVPVAGLLFAAVFLREAPGFLVCAEPPRQADAVILYAGPELVERFDEAIRLLRHGYADNLVIPAFGLILDKAGAEILENDHKGLKLQGRVFQVRKLVHYRKYQENTHVESLEAKRLFDERGFRSALLVSSPYHLRRIRLINSQVFTGNKYALTYIQSSNLQNPSFADPGLRKTIISEYLKIAWFLLYGFIG